MHQSIARIVSNRLFLLSEVTSANRAMQGDNGLCVVSYALISSMIKFLLIFISFHLFAHSIAIFAN